MRFSKVIESYVTFILLSYVISIWFQLILIFLSFTLNMVSILEGSTRLIHMWISMTLGTHQCSKHTNNIGVDLKSSVVDLTRLGKNTGSLWIGIDLNTAVSIAQGRDRPSPIRVSKQL